MRLFAFVSLLAALVGTAAFGGDPYPFKRSDGKWGYVDNGHFCVVDIIVSTQDFDYNYVSEEC